MSGRVPVVRHPEEAGNTEAQLEVTADIVVVQRLVEPVAISKDDAAHY
jgi:hypothetical protein